jgi:demethylmenaquinone methyltransferase/2-methoxy-6-polyprenyl-1,4-benzoquinol methylase
VTRDVSLFDRFARAYDAAMIPADGDRLAAGLAYAHRPVERVVDVGGGTGRGARAVEAAEQLVVDAAPGMLRRVPAGIDRVAGDATRLPLRADSADAVLIVDALHHMPDHAAVLAEAARVLRPGGVLVVREFDPTTLRGLALDIAEALVGFGSTFRQPDDLARLARRAGLEVAIPDRGFGYSLVGVLPESTTASTAAGGTARAGGGPAERGERRA